MSEVRQYLLGIVAAALICSLATAMTGDKGFCGAAMRLLTGCFLILTVVSPLLDLRFDTVLDYTASFKSQAEEAVASGENNASLAMSEIIKAQTEAYILDKAESLGVSVTVCVSLSEEELPVPTAVTLTGNISPYAKNRLSAILKDDLGIPTEAQKWIIPQ